MAFKPIRADDSVRYVSVSDPSIEWEKTCEKYQGEFEKAQKDPADIKIEDWLKRRYFTQAQRGGTLEDFWVYRDGERPTVFVIGVIPPGDLSRIDDGGRQKINQRFWECFLFSVRGIENPPSADLKVPTINRGGIEYVDPTWLRDTFVRGLQGIAQEVGRQAWLWNQFTQEDSKN